ncbi:uncharacterized protein LOC120464097 isoform X2 [Pimephales promelas]|uniref:uncharacterized protein LOC120464097 isoform X2 n=1 Tax=Pimephales promelas TaxID=90988 RepID=UPI001955A89B|nr:uncharacterized protein LOC120464097 isoform X2 [Pimephales promelas]
MFPKGVPKDLVRGPCCEMRQIVFVIPAGWSAASVSHECSSSCAMQAGVTVLQSKRWRAPDDVKQWHRSARAFWTSPRSAKGPAGGPGPWLWGSAGALRPGSSAPCSRMCNSAPYTYAVKTLMAGKELKCSALGSHGSSGPPEEPFPLAEIQSPSNLKATTNYHSSPPEPLPDSVSGCTKTGNFLLILECSIWKLLPITRFILGCFTRFRGNNNKRFMRNTV